jgi:hypothetical protein
MLRAALRLVMPLVLTVAASAPAAAQLPFDGCIDRHDRPVRTVVRNDLGGWAGQATLVNDEPVIYWNADANGRLSRPAQIFIYLHECAHHMLGHLWKPNALKWEMEADCWAVQRMWESGMLDGQHIAVIERELRTTRADEHHLGGNALMRALQRCLDVKTDQDAWAAALTAFTAASRDGFAAIRGQAIPPHGASGRFETAVDLPGTYDCEITPAREVRCTVFAAREAQRTRTRHRELAKIIRAWLPPLWTTDERGTESDEGVTHSFVAEDGEHGIRIELVATPANRITFAMTPPRDAPGAPPMVTPEVVARSLPPQTAAEPPSRRALPPSRRALPPTLPLGTRVRIRVPQLARSWITAHVTATAIDPPCLAFALDRTDASGRQQFAFLRAVAAIEIDARGDGAMLAGGSDQAEGDWVAFPLSAARRQDAGCRRG